MMIPKQLSNCRFIKTNESKRPVENNWPSTANYSYEEFKFDKTYGILCGRSNLIVIDVDAKYIQDKLIIEKEEFRKTFTVKTAIKKLYHFYFFVTNYEGDEPKGFRIDNIRGERIIDFQGKGTQVIGPGSIIDGMGEYEIINNNEILTINYNYLKTIITNIDDNLKIKENKKSKKSTLIFPEFDEVCAAIKEKLSIHDILPHLGIEVSPTKSNTHCPLGHTSDGGKCFSYTTHVWNCFHCGESGNIFQLWTKAKKVKFLEAKQELARLAGIEQSLKQKIKDLMRVAKTRNVGIELLAKEFMKLYHVYTIRNDSRPEVFIYKDGIYTPNGQTYVYEFVRNIIENLYQETYANKVVEKVIVDTFIDEQLFYTSPDLNLIPFENCVLNLETMEMLDYTPKMRFFNKHPVIYDPLIEIDQILVFIKDIIKGENDLKTLQELCGYLLWRENRFEKAIMLLGNGRNGKSKFIDLLKEIVGHHNIVNISLSEIEKDTFAASNFHNKHANFSPDLSKEVLECTGKFKSLIGRDTITANRKHRTNIQFKNFAKFIFASNNLPYTTDHSDGFFDRWTIIDFPYKFVDKPTKLNEKLKDPNIIEKICNPKELSGLVNWSLQGLKRLFKNGEFTISDSTDGIKKKWMRESSSISGFWEDCINYTKSKDDFIPVSDFDFAYTDYCVIHDVEQDNRSVKSARLKQLGASYGRRTGARGYIGIKLTGKYEYKGSEIDINSLRDLQ